MWRSFRPPELSFVRCVLLLSSLSVAIPVATVCAGDKELANNLVGKWEGILLVRGDEHRTLIIQSVKRQREEWIAVGRFGVTEKPLRRVDIKITIDGNSVTLDFDLPAGPVRLKQEADDYLAGHLRVILPEGQGFRPTRLTLKRVE